MTYTIRIVAPNFCAGVVCIDDRVIEAAPILNWARRAGAKKLKAWARSKGFTVEQTG